jgi:hypothetical protein
MITPAETDQTVSPLYCRNTFLTPKNNARHLDHDHEYSDVRDHVIGERVTGLEPAEDDGTGTTNTSINITGLVCVGKKEELFWTVDETDPIHLKCLSGVDVFFVVVAQNKKQKDLLAEFFHHRRGRICYRPGACVVVVPNRSPTGIRWSRERHRPFSAGRA